VSAEWHELTVHSAISANEQLEPW